jgi:hypothetical protein
VDVNLFSILFTNKNDNIEFAETFERHFADQTGLTRTLGDEQPRGTGRAVNFEIEAGMKPIWGQLPQAQASERRESTNTFRRTK